MTEFIKLELSVSKEGIKVNGVLYKANIEFDNNEIKICDEGKENDNWFNEFMQEPQVSKRYSIEYQGKTYSVLAETLLCLIIYKLKKELKGIINQFQLIIEDDRDKEIAERIKSSLLVINIPNSFTEIDEETYLNKPRSEYYAKEDFMIRKIIEGEEEYLRFKRKIERAKQINPNDSRLLEITDYNTWYT